MRRAPASAQLTPCGFLFDLGTSPQTDSGYVAQGHVAASYAHETRSRNIFGYKYAAPRFYTGYCVLGKQAPGASGRGSEKTHFAKEHTLPAEGGARRALLEETGKVRQGKHSVQRHRLESGWHSGAGRAADQWHCCLSMPYMRSASYLSGCASWAHQLGRVFWRAPRSGLWQRRPCAFRGPRCAPTRSRPPLPLVDICTLTVN